MVSRQRRDSVATVQGYLKRNHKSKAKTAKRQYPNHAKNSFKVGGKLGKFALSRNHNDRRVWINNRAFRQGLDFDRKIAVVFPHYLLKGGKNELVYDTYRWGSTFVKSSFGQGKGRNPAL